MCLNHSLPVHCELPASSCTHTLGLLVHIYIMHRQAFCSYSQPAPFFFGNTVRDKADRQSNQWLPDRIERQELLHYHVIISGTHQNNHKGGLKCKWAPLRSHFILKRLQCLYLIKQYVQENRCLYVHGYSSSQLVELGNMFLLPFWLQGFHSAWCSHVSVGITWRNWSRPLFGVFGHYKGSTFVFIETYCSGKTSESLSHQQLCLCWRRLIMRLVGARGDPRSLSQCWHELNNIMLCFASVSWNSYFVFLVSWSQQELLLRLCEGSDVCANTTR